MNKYRNRVFFILFFVFIFSSCQDNKTSSLRLSPTKPEDTQKYFPIAANRNTEIPPTITPTPEPTPHVFRESDFRVVLDIDFDNPQDLKYFEFPDGPVDDSILTDGNLRFVKDAAPHGRLPLQDFNTSAIHIRWKITEKMTGFEFKLPVLYSDSTSWDEENEYYLFSSFNSKIVKGEFFNSPPRNTITDTLSQGNIIAVPDTWVDTIIWIEKGEYPSINLFSWEEENADYYHYSKTSFQKDIHPVVFNSLSIEAFDGVIELDSIQTINKNMDSYLWFNAPVFQTNFTEISKLINTAPFPRDPEMDQYVASPDTFSEDQYQIYLDTTFENEFDLTNFDRIPNGSRYIPEEGLLVNDQLWFIPHIIYGEALHIRWKISDDDTCLSLIFWPKDKQDVINLSRILNPAIEACTYSQVSAEYFNQTTQGLKVPEISRGMVFTETDKWLDTVLWFSKEDVPIFHVLTWETDNPNIFSMYKSRLTGLEVADNYKFIFNTSHGSTIIKSFRLINHGIESYLWFNAPPYQRFYEENKAVLTADITSKDLIANHTRTSQNLQSLTREPQTYQEDQYIIPLDIQFDIDQEKSYFSGYGSSENIYIKDGVSEFSPYKVNIAELRVPIKYDTAIHYRWNFTQEKSCSTFSLIPKNFSDYEMNYLYNLQVMACQAAPLTVEAVQKNPVSMNTPFEAKGDLEIKNGQWMDMVFWIESGRMPVLKLLSWETDHPENYFVTSKALSGFDEADHYIFNITSLAGAMQLDSVQLISRDIQSYLWFNSPAFQKNYSDINPVLYANIDESIAAIEAEKQQTIANLRQEAPDFTEQLDKIYSIMVTYDDLPLNYRMYPIEQSVLDSGNSMQFSKTYQQGPTSSGGGLWLTNVLTIYDKPIDDHEALLELVGYNSKNDELHDRNQSIGDFTVVFNKKPFERFVFSKGNIVVDLYCNSLFTGAHPYCSSNSLSQLAQSIVDRLPENLEKPEQIAVAIPERNSNIFSSTLVMKDEQQNRLVWDAKQYFSSMSLALYNTQQKKFVYYSDIVDVAKYRIGYGESSIITGNPGEYNPLPAGDNLLYVITDQQNAGEIHVFLEE